MIIIIDVDAWKHVFTLIDFSQNEWIGLINILSTACSQTRIQVLKQKFDFFIYFGFKLGHSFEFGE